MKVVDFWNEGISIEDLNCKDQRPFYCGVCDRFLTIKGTSPVSAKVRSRNLFSCIIHMYQEAHKK